MLAATRQFAAKMGSAFAAVVLLVALTGLLSLIAFREVGEAALGEAISRPNVPLEAERLRGWLHEEALAHRRYLDDRSPQALAMRDAARSAFGERVAVVRSRITDANGEERLSRIDLAARDLFLAEDRTALLPPPVDNVVRLELDEQLNGVERQIDQLVNQQQFQSDIAHRNARRTFNRGQRFIALAAGAAIFIAAGLATFLVRRLTRSFQRAQEAIRTRERFLTYASEELSRPINSLAHQLEPLREAMQTQGTAVVPIGLSQRIDLASREVRRLSGLVNELVDASHMHSIRLRREPVDLARLVRDVEKRFEGQFVANGPTIVVQANRSAMGMWDRERMEQVVTQLLSNAVKYGRSKVVRVIVEPGNPTRIIVRDHGSGMSNDQLSHIFEAYEAGVFKHEQGSLGLGLYIVRQIVEAHGGRIRVESAPTLGSTFIVELPPQPPAPQPERRAWLSREPPAYPNE